MKDIIIISNTVDQFREENKFRVGNLATFMEPEWIDDLCVMLVIEKIEIALPSYTQFAFCSIRGLEEFCKRLAKELNVPITGRHGSQLGYIFEVKAGRAFYRNPGLTSSLVMTNKQSESFGSALAFSPDQSAHAQRHDLRAYQINGEHHEGSNCASNTTNRKVPDRLANLGQRRSRCWEICRGGLDWGFPLFISASPAAVDS
ncbi:MAG: hypothetical protein EOP04_22165, partial [Proteobacteria bacterium]